ncbi:MAG: penicillin-binding protein 2, partial [Bacteroidales bacterium]|nr:penicillin-binding protein 2 [Bacteroidales bacterium]
NFAAIIANKGYYKIPHVVKAIKDSSINISYQIDHYTDIKKQYFEIVTEGMYLAVNGGAGSTAHIAKISEIDVCGKTGTAQNPHGKDHSVFMAFAPRQNPKIAIAVVIENGGYGATIAAPITRLMIEKYLNDSISQPYLEKYVLEKK